MSFNFFKNEKTQEEEKQIQINLNIANKIENVWKSVNIYSFIFLCFIGNET